MLRDISLETLKRAAEIREQIEGLEDELDALLSGKVPARRGRKPGRKAKAVAKKKRGGKRNMSPEGIARIKAAQKKRWDAIRAKQAAESKPKAKKAAKANPKAAPKAKAAAKKKAAPKQKAAKK